MLVIRKKSGQKRKSVDLAREIESRSEYKQLLSSEDPLEVASKLEKQHMKKMKTETKSVEDLKKYHREMRAMYKQAIKMQSFTKVSL